MSTEKKYFINFGPELLNLLGPNLYTNIYYVLGELIANAHDANAKNVYIIYDSEQDLIIVEDDGHGMTYEQINENFLPVGIPTRYNDETSLTEGGKRRKIGRKGIGKLGSLTVSEEVHIYSKRDGVKSGCILSLSEIRRDSDGKFEIPGIDDDEISFIAIDKIPHGSAIKMTNCKFRLHKTMESVKRNISLIFPFTVDDFKIHLWDLYSGGKATIEDYGIEIIKSVDTLITFTDQSFSRNDKLLNLSNSFNDDRYYDELKQKLQADEIPERKIFKRHNAPIRKSLKLTTTSGAEGKYELIIGGWVATYATTRGKQKRTDFPVAHLSIISNGKLGEFNIIPNITQDRLYESYVVGQLFIDLLEDSNLPDISLSNRQGYKAEDPRYVKVLELAEKWVLNPILNLKTEAMKYKNYAKDIKERKKLEEEKEKFDISYQNMMNIPSFTKAIQEAPEIKDELLTSWNIKKVLQENYKKIMISHCRTNKVIVDELEKILHFCGIGENEIIYTSSDYSDSRITPFEDIYKYLKQFFVETVYSANLCVIYIFDKEFSTNWNTSLEAGAGWVIESKAFSLYIDEYKSVKEPIKKGSVLIPRCSIDMETNIDIQNLARAIVKICTFVGKTEKTDEQVIDFIKTTKLYKEQIFN